MVKIKFIIALIAVLLSIKVKANYPSFKCQEGLSLNQEAICNNLFLSLVEGLDFKLREKFKDKNLKGAQDYHSQTILSSFQENLNIIISDFNDVDLLKKYEKIPKLNSYNINNYLLFVYYLITKDDDYRKSILGSQIIDITKLLKTTSFKYVEDSDSNGEFLIFDLENDGILDLIDIQKLGSLHVPHIFKMCKKDESLIYQKCSDDIGYGYEMHGKMIKNDEDFIEYFQNDYIGDVAYGTKLFFLENRIVTERARTISNKSVKYECSLGWLKYMYEKDNNIYISSKPNSLNNECNTNATDEVLFTLTDLNIKNDEFELCKINLNNVKNKKNDKYKKSFETCNFKKYNEAELENKTFVEICHINEKQLPEEYIVYMQSIFQKGSSTENIRSLDKCQDKYNEILKTGVLKLDFCNIGSVNSVSFLKKFNNLDTLEITSGYAPFCYANGVENVTDLAILTKKNFKKIELNVQLETFNFRNFLRNYMELDFNSINFNVYSNCPNEYFKEINSKNLKTRFLCSVKKHHY